jgi:ABC-type transport system involved in multi-copper enzyme maturation permease subunit
MKRNTHDTLLSFLGGASWAFAIVGVWVTFQSFIFLGFITALLFSFLFLFIAFLVIVVLENLSLSRDHYDESLKQTALLEEIRDTQKLTESSALE